MKQQSIKFSRQKVKFPIELLIKYKINCIDRPLTDPVIVHVTDIKQALSLVDIGLDVENLFRFLAEKFWPGPLTIITKAKSIIPACVTANTGYVGMRCPNSEVLYYYNKIKL